MAAAVLCSDWITRDEEALAGSLAALTPFHVHLQLFH